MKGDAAGIRPAADSGIERVDRRHLLWRELEVEDGEVLGDAGGLDRLRDRRPLLLQVPAQHDLGWRLAVLAGELEQLQVREGRPFESSVRGDAADRRPGLGGDPVLRVHPLQRGLLEVRVQLDLVHGGHDGRRAQQPGEVLGHEERNGPLSCA
jgi:hypothetical protein